MQAWGTGPPISHTLNLIGTKERHQVSRMAPLWQTWMPLGVEDRFCRDARTTLIHVGLEQAAQQFAAFNLQQRFQFTVGHLVDLRRVQLRDEVLEMLVGGGIGVGPGQGISDSTGWHHQSSWLFRYVISVSIRVHFWLV